jgi:hypothetical protein
MQRPVHLAAVRDLQRSLVLLLTQVTLEGQQEENQDSHI